MWWTVATGPASRPRSGDELVAEDVEAVGAVGHEAPEPDGSERRRDAGGRLPERCLLAHPARRVARARLGGAQDGELHARRLEEARGRPGDPLPVGIEGARAADPVQDVRRLAGPEHANAEVRRPGERGPPAPRRTDCRAPWWPRAPARRGGVDRAGLDEPATQVDQLVQDLDLERARADARGARRAGPGLVRGDEGLERAPLAHRLEGRLDDPPRIERLARRGRRAHGRAPAAADARGGVEELGPGEARGHERSAARRGRRQAARRAELPQRELGRAPRPCGGGRSPRSGRRRASRARRGCPRAPGEAAGRPGPSRARRPASVHPTNDQASNGGSVTRDARRFERGSRSRRSRRAGARIASAAPLRSRRGTRRPRRRHAVQPTPARKARPAHSRRNEKTR